ncbi:hypothetical protein ACFL5K_02495 [Gemmatimonadota bacterium]
MKLTLIAALLMLCNSVTLSAVELTVKERSGIDRIDEPVTSGIPLPQGYEDNAAHLYLESEGKAVKAHIRPINRWPDGSLRWVQTNFVASLAAGQEMPLLLVRGNAPTIESALKVVEDNFHITVSNSLIKVAVRKSGFNVLDRVELISNGRSLIESDSRGLSAVIDGDEYLSANDKDCKVDVESNNPFRVVVKAEGALKKQGGQKIFDYICRLYFHEGTPVVRVVYSIEYRNQNVEKKVVIESLDLELNLAEKERFVIGREGANVEGKLTSNGSAWVLAPSSSEYAFGGAASHAKYGNPKTEKSDDLGWIASGSDNGAVAAGLRAFWQMHPSSLEISEGKLKVGMVSAITENGVEIYPGTARTHYIRLAFLDKFDPERLHSAAAACQKPLLVVATPSHYCRGSEAIGKLTERRASLGNDYNGQVVAHLNEELDKGLQAMWQFVDSRDKNGITVEGYGFLEWGEGMHHVWENGIDNPYNISWNGHYYDLPHMCLTEFLRSGNFDWFDYSLSRAWNQMDVHVTHFDQGNFYNGSNRYCPPREHVRIDDGRVYVSNTTNHHKTQGLFEHYYLTGDERMRDVALKALDYANAFGAYSNFRQPRGAAFQVLTLVEGYRHTADEKYLETARSTFELWNERAAEADTLYPGGHFMIGFLTEAFINLYLVDPNPEIVKYIRTTVEWMRKNRPDYYPNNMALAVGFLAHKFQDQSYYELMHKHLETWSGLQGNQFKDFANHGRSLARAIYYLAGQH